MVWTTACTTAAVVDPVASVLTLLLGVLIQFGTSRKNWQEWYSNLRKAPWSPPNWLFGVVWPILYATLAAAGILLTYHYEQPSSDTSSALYIWTLVLYYAQFPLNTLWVFLFFGIRQPSFAVVSLFVNAFTAIAAEILAWFVNWQPGVLLLPYCAWLLFAFSLNVYIVAVPQETKQR